jgi:hypothetical protein
MDDLAETEPTTNGSVPSDTVETAPAPASAPLAGPDDPTLSTVVRADGRRRRRTAVLVLVAAVLAGAAGMWIGSRIQSPADRAAARQAPTPSLVTVPVERRQLTSELALSGEVAYNEPLTVTLAGAVGLEPGETAVVTELREAGTEINEGDVLVEVTTRPVFVLQGELPMYRRLVVGTEGPDVGQLEQALVRLGYEPGTVDTVFDSATASAVEQMYADASYTAEGPSTEQRTDLAAARDAVTASERGVTDAQKALADAQRPLPESQRLQLQQAVDAARDAIPAAQAALTSTQVEHDQRVATARASRDTARTVRDGAASVRDSAQQPDAIDPDTGEAYTPERIAALDVAAAEAQQAYTQAEGELAIAEQARTGAVAAADDAIDNARVQLRIAQAQLDEGTTAADTGPLQEAVTAAEAALATAQAELAALEASAGTRISPGEIVFAPVLPATLTETYLALGSTVDGPVGMLATTDTLIRARIARADAPMVAVGAEVAVEIRDAGISTTGTVLSVGQPQQQPGVGDQGGPGGGGGDGGRMEVVVAPSGGTELGNYMFFGARVRVPIDATDGEVLVVPVAALTVGPDETSQVEVERSPATDDTPAETELVAVTVGLTANGLAEVAPIEPGTLEEGDRVVIGVDSHLLPGNADGAADAGNDDDSQAADEQGGQDDGGKDDGGKDDGGKDDGGKDDGGDDEGDDGGDGESVTSPLAELMGWVSDPVEQRRQELEIQEQVADCMKAEGFEYTPVDWSAQMPETDVDMSDPKAYGEKYGYGVMYNYETYELGNNSGEGGVSFEDPNMEYVNSLSPAEQEAYNKALYGDPRIWEQPPTTAAGGDSAEPAVGVAPPLDQQGCDGQARLAVMGEDPASDPEVQNMLNDFFQSQQNDPRLEAMVADWAECFQPKLDEYGIDTPLKNIYDGYQIMDAAKYEALGAEVLPVANQAEIDEYYNSGDNVLSAYTDETGAGSVVIAPAGELPELTGDQIDELTAMELDLWKADQACQDEIGYAEFTRQQEQEMVDRLVAQFPELGS